jgi:hypothetical protein
MRKDSIISLNNPNSCLPFIKLLLDILKQSNFPISSCSNIKRYLQKLNAKASAPRDALQKPFDSKQIIVAASKVVNLLFILNLILSLVCSPV